MIAGAAGASRRHDARERGSKRQAVIAVQVSRAFADGSVRLDGVVAPENGKDLFDFSEEGVRSYTFGMLEIPSGIVALNYARA